MSGMNVLKVGPDRIIGSRDMGVRQVAPDYGMDIFNPQFSCCSYDLCGVMTYVVENYNL